MRIITVVLVCLIKISFAQENTNTFRSPLGIPLYLSGTFAELRGNHFHGGLDIKTNGKEGYRIYSVQDGYVSRVKVQAGGYGHALYVQHNNGYTSVYGHLSAFKMGIDEYVKQQQYSQQSFEVDLYLSPNQFPVSRGDVIALSGNSGSSGGPHLHFELRKTAGQIPVNPLKFYSISDHINPTIYGLRIHDLSNGFYQSQGQTHEVQYISPGKYKLNSPVTVHTNVIGFSIKAIDKLDGSNNRNGFYGLRLYIDEQLTYSYQKDAVGFDETRHINAHIDYPEKKRGGGTYANCFLLKGNQLQFLQQFALDGRVWLSQYKERHARIEIFDYKGNTSTLAFEIRNETKQDSVSIYSNSWLHYNQANQVNQEEFNAFIPQGAMYDNVALDYEVVEQTSTYPVYSRFHRLQTEEIPLQQFMTVEVKQNQFPVELRSKALLANINSRGKIDVNTGFWSGDYFRAKTRNFGTYFITSDTSAPRIRQYQAPANNNYTSTSTMKFIISDDLSGIKEYRAQVDGTWILMEYDSKRNLLYHTFDDRITKGKHQMILTVKDAVGNETTETLSFTR